MVNKYILKRFSGHDLMECVHADTIKPDQLCLEGHSISTVLSLSLAVLSLSLAVLSLSLAVDIESAHDFE